MRLLARVLTGALAVVVVYLGVTAAQVWTAAGVDQRRRSDAIVVLGAAQYNGRPSPALRARLDHAAALYDAGMAPVVAVTGGQQPGDTFSEASASDLYLQRKGVPPEALRLETQGLNTYESLAAAARFLRREGRREVLLVSDPWHSYRARSIAEEVGLHPRVSPAGGELSSHSVRRLLRETAAVALGRLVGYRRLTRLDEAASGELGAASERQRTAARATVRGSAPTPRGAAV